ncbi:lytic murein transglycosylase [Pseudidiomarina salinarum]|uniref:Lytic murein transglycosylase n=1 Tax=Pseudidiomarina salinarum TaxID=435908 RepID=A0A094IV37_9GAMM|nr:lytic murein transglycosylase B [Pseudidiomarina salinarum]KFZ31545.1 lytic murein transglycosylase [Pseudidiomarina salinarum]RUO70689.1 lytic murein transglycosylase B [Pseudidiomarina salinarum]
MLNFIRPAITVSLLFMGSATFAAPPVADQTQHQAFIDELVEQHQFSRAEVTGLLAQAQLNNDVLEAIQRPWEAKPWHQYHPIFLTEKRLDAGLRFWNEHAETLARAEQEYGVPAEVIVAIIGVETFYGSYLGNYPVLDALYTLGFHYPPRASFFRSELREFFILSREEGLNPRDLKGSYAGAMGFGQFISSSYRHYAVDFDGDGVRDLLTNPVDAIGSVANYFARHGWQQDAPVALKLPPSDRHAALVGKGLKPEQSVAELSALGLRLPADAALDSAQPAKVFAFAQVDSEEHWLGLQNFYVITRYNHSPLYAMVVHQFSEQLAQGHYSREN